MASVTITLRPNLKVRIRPSPRKEEKFESSIGLVSSFRFLPRDVKPPLLSFYKALKASNRVELLKLSEDKTGEKWVNLLIKPEYVHGRSNENERN